MAAPSSNALARRSTDTVLMPPPSKRIKRPQRVLDEDTYTSAISEIIARDFFPGLLETETQQEYLDALDSKDDVWISSASRRLSQIMTPGRIRGRRGTSIQTPSQNFRATSETPRGYQGETPRSVISESPTPSTIVEDKIPVDTNMSLSSFQSKYTSEDNESFYKLLDNQNQKKAEKYAWMWRNNKLPSNRLLKQKEVETKLLESGRSLEDDGGKKDRLAIKDARDKPAMPDSWVSKPNNSLMFAPDGMEDSVETVAQRAQTESRAAPKQVVYSNTRIPVISMKETGPPPSPSLSAVRDAIAGHPRGNDSETDYDGSETPRVNGYAFVDDEPETEEIDKSPVIFELGKGEAMPNPFRIKEQSAREDLHHKMVERVAKNKRTASTIGLTGKTPQATPVPKFPSSPRVDVGSLTPAAQRLWSKVGTPGQAKSSGFFGSSSTPRIGSNTSKLKMGWTPK